MEKLEELLNKIKDLSNKAKDCKHHLVYKLSPDKCEAPGYENSYWVNCNFCGSTLLKDESLLIPTYSDPIDGRVYYHNNPSPVKFKLGDCHLGYEEEK